MKLLSFNIALYKDNAQAVVNYIRQQDPDLIALQEVTKPEADTVKPMFRSKEVLDRQLGGDYPYNAFCPLWQIDKDQDRDYGGYVTYGLYLLSKFEIIATSNIFYQGSFQRYANTDFFYQGIDHGRALQLVELKIADKELLDIAHIHGAWSKDKLDSQNSQIQTDFLLEKLNATKKPLILAGDFNLLPSTEAVRRLSTVFTNHIAAAQVSATRPQFTDMIEQGDNAIDYIFTNPQVDVRSFQVDKVDISDHYPLLLEFSI